MTQFEHSSSCVFLCTERERERERVLLPAISTASRQGPCSFDDLNTVDREACQQRGMLENDRQHNEAQIDAAVELSPSALRSLFAVILTLCEPSDSFQLCLLTRRTSVNH